MKNILIIGARSYVGRRLMRYWTDAGMNPVGWASSDCNLLDIDNIRSAIAALPKGDWHVVFLSVINKFKQNDSQAFTQNIQIIKNFIDASRTFSIASLIYFSAVDVYGVNPPNPICEASPILPESWYSLAKFNGEWLFQHYLCGDFPVCCARIPGVYGLGGEERSIPYRMIQSALRDKIISIEGDGNNLRDMLHLDDLSAIVNALVESPYDGVLNLVSGKSFSINQIAVEVQRLFATPPTIKHIEAHSARNFDLVFDCTTLHRVCSARPQVELHMGIMGYAPLITKVR